MRRKGNPSALLVGKQISAVIVESSIELSQKLKNATALKLSNSISGNISEETPNTN